MSTHSEEPTAAGVPAAGADVASQDAHGGSLLGPDAGTTTGTTDATPPEESPPLDPLDQPAAGGDSDAESAQGDGAPDSH